MARSRAPKAIRLRATYRNLFDIRKWLSTIDNLDWWVATECIDITIKTIHVDSHLLSRMQEILARLKYDLCVVMQTKVHETGTTLRDEEIAAMTRSASSPAPP